MALRIIFKISNTALVFSRSFFIFSGIVSALFLPLGKPMAKRRNRVMFSGPYPLAGMAGTLPAVPVWIGATLVLVATPPPLAWCWGACTRSVGVLSAVGGVRADPGVCLMQSPRYGKCRLTRG